MYTNVSQIKDFLHLSPSEVSDIERVIAAYPMKISDYYLKLIDPANPNDPIRKMCVPAPDGLNEEGSLDTSNEASNTVLPGLQHKYKQTALLLSTNDCFTYCRHCFRRRLVGLENSEISDNFSEVISYIGSHKEINNVLISGGDSMALSNEHIFAYLDKFSHMNHLNYIRFGTRAPVTYPMRITGDPALLKGLEAYNQKKHIIFVTQFNHPREITKESSAAVHALKKIGLSVYNQTVLLKGINDDVSTLSKLFSLLTTIGCRQYYVFQCRPVKGVKNRFQLPLSEGVQIVEQAKALQSGAAKNFKFCLSHPRGKIEILGIFENDKLLFKFHEAKDQSECGKIFTLNLPPQAGWLPDTFSE